MIRHIVMWSLHNPAEAARFKSLLDSCAGLVPGIVEFDVGIRESGLDANIDVVLVSTFTDTSQLDAYQNHPHHKEVGAQLATLRASRHVLDYTCGSARSAA